MIGLYNYIWHLKILFLKIRTQKDKKALAVERDDATVHEIAKQTAENVNKISPETSEDDDSSEEDEEISKTCEKEIKTFSPPSKIPRPEIHFFTRNIPPSKSKIPVLKNSNSFNSPQFIPRSNSITDTKATPFGSVRKGVNPSLLKRFNSKPNILD